MAGDKMNCNLCNFTIGATYRVSSNYYFCEDCNEKLNYFFPRNAIYKGLEGYTHRFVFSKPFNCPGCNDKKITMATDCKKGILINVHQTISKTTTDELAR